MGQFERTLIIAEEGSLVSYVEGCTAPTYSSSSLHSAVVEIIAMPGARVRYYTIQNWSKNIYNLVTKRAFAFKDSAVEWIDCNLGSGVTIKYPAVVLKGESARAEILSSQWQVHQDKFKIRVERKPTKLQIPVLALSLNRLVGVVVRVIVVR